MKDISTGVVRSFSIISCNFILYLIHLLHKVIIIKCILVFRFTVIKFSLIY